MKNKKQKVAAIWAAILACVIYIFMPAYSVSANTEYASAQEKEEIKEIKEINENSLYAKSAVLMDADSGRVLYGKNASAPYAMASTTKIMTCILALELGKPDQIVTFSKTAASMPDVQMNTKEGKQ